MRNYIFHFWNLGEIITVIFVRTLPYKLETNVLEDATESFKTSSLLYFKPTRVSQSTVLTLDIV
jgi:hypothetical protein